MRQIECRRCIGQIQERYTKIKKKCNRGLWTAAGARHLTLVVYHISFAFSLLWFERCFYLAVSYSNFFFLELQAAAATASCAFFGLSKTLHSAAGKKRLHW